MYHIMAVLKEFLLYYTLIYINFNLQELLVHKMIDEEYDEL